MAELGWLGAMGKESPLNQKVYQEIAKFRKTMQELRLLKTVSRDLKNYRRMLKLKKYD